MKKIETIAEYQQLASRTCPDLGTPELNLFHMNTGIITEIGEAIDPIKKHIAYKKELDVVNIGEEIADACWYIANKSRMFLPKKFNENIWLTSGGIFDTCLADFNTKGMTISSILDAAEALYAISSDIKDFQKVSLSLEKYVGVPDMVVLCKVAEYFKLDFWQILTNNIEKLQIRYPEKFTNEAALNRNLDAEREVLEKTDSDGTAKN